MDGARKSFVRRLNLKPGETETLQVRGLVVKFYHDRKGRLHYRIDGGKVKLKRDIPETP